MAFFGRNKSIQSVLNMKAYLLEISLLLECPLENWTLSEIMTAWCALENLGKRQLTTGGWLKKVNDIRAAMEMMGIKIMDKYVKEVKFLTAEFVKERIDFSSRPHVKRKANEPPYYVWKILAEESSKDCFERYVRL